jgi:NAD(P)-dependent dehydrogenase (short-subunit alcohol dehydrogenase family)
MEGHRVCLFTGISGTLGLDFAARYADTYEIVGVYNTTPPAVPMAPLDATSRDPGAIFGIQADLTTPGAVEGVVEQVVARFESVDLFVAAAAHRRFGLAKEVPYVNTLVRQFNMNVCVPIRFASALARLAWMHTPDENRQRGRNIVNLSSTAGHHVYPLQIGYAASKAALDLATRHLAVEMAEFGIRANAIAPTTFPGLVTTDSVNDAIVWYDGSDRTGDVWVIDTWGQSLLPEAVPG